MERIVIIDHDNHRLYVEDIYDDMLQNYNGEVQSYIDDNYTLGLYSWDYIIDAEYIPNYGEYEYGDPIEIDFENIRDI